MRNHKHNQSGILLIEVLFAILIFSFGILGLVGLQAISIKNSVSAEDRNTAALLANDLIARMYIRKTSRLVASPIPVAGENPAGLVADIAIWQANIASPNSRLPGAIGTVTVAGGITTIMITWQAPGKTTVNQYFTQIVI